MELGVLREDAERGQVGLSVARLDAPPQRGHVGLGVADGVDGVERAVDSGAFTMKGERGRGAGEGATSEGDGHRHSYSHIPIGAAL